MFLSNYHTHTELCLHASGTVGDYCRAAAEAGLVTLGMSDHTPLPDGRWDHVRMRMEQLPGYVDAVRSAAIANPSLRIFAGLECEYAPEYESFFRDELPDKYGIEYLLLGQHWFLHKGEWVSSFDRGHDAALLGSYARHLIEAMSTGLFAFVAHPDCFGAAGNLWGAEYDAISRDILAAAEELCIPLEINAYGFRKPLIATTAGERPMYPLVEFWRLAAEYDIKVVISSDAHRPCDIVANMYDALALAKECGLAVTDGLTAVLGIDEVMIQE